MAYLDLKKAFDTVDHTLLCSKLAEYGVDGSANKIIQNYLSDRHQVTKFKGKNSRPGEVTCGVPQGSILGPLLFIIYLNDMPSIVRNCRIALYADDTAIYYTGNSIESVQMNLQEDIDCINFWLQANKLTLNIQKTKVMLFTPFHYRLDKVLDIFVGDQKLEQVNHYNDSMT